MISAISIDRESRNSIEGGHDMDFPVIDLKKTGIQIKEMCRHANLNASQIQRHLNLSCVQTVYKWFSGENVPSIENFYALSLLLGVSMEDLIVTKNKPDHSLFWQKHIHLITDKNRFYEKRMLLYCQ